VKLGQRPKGTAKEGGRSEEDLVDGEVDEATEDAEDITMT